MIEINGKYYYKIGDVAAICNKKPQTILNWDRYSDILEKEGKERLVPKAERLNNQRIYTKEQVKEIEDFSKNMKRGDIAEYSRTRNGKRGREIQERIDKKISKQ